MKAEIPKYIVYPIYESYDEATQTILKHQVIQIGTFFDIVKYTGSENECEDWIKIIQQVGTIKGIATYVNTFIDILQGSFL